MRIVQKERPPTLKTIALRTGISVTAVSRALKDAPDISQETKDHVRQVAQMLGYRPSRAGVRLRTGKTQVICLILNTEEEIMGITGQMVAGISEKLQDSNYHLVLTPYTHSDDPMAPVRYVVETGSADGVILSRTEFKDRRVDYLLANNMPFATHGRTMMGIEHPWHDFDNEAFSFHGAKRLMECGAKRIGLIAPPHHLAFAHHMREGFERAQQELGFETVAISGITIDDNLDTIDQYIRQLMQDPLRPDGIICGAGSACMAATSGIEAVGLKVGKDVHLVAKQSSHILKRFRPEIHVVHESMQQAGSELADFVVRRINGEEPKDLQHLVFGTNGEIFLDEHP